MTAPQRPRRQNRGDRLTSINATVAEVAVDHAVAPFDRVAREMEQRWGVDRLPALVSPETAGKYGFSIGRLNECIVTGDAEQAAAWAAVCIRGMAAMDAEAKAAGHDQLPPDYLEIEYDGRIFAIMRNIEEWPRLKKLRPDVFIFSAREAANALNVSQKAMTTIDAIRESIPAAEVTAVRPFEDDNLEDLFK